MDRQMITNYDCTPTDRFDNLCAHSQRFFLLAAELKACGMEKVDILALWENVPTLENYLKSLAGDPLWERKLKAYRIAFMNR